MSALAIGAAISAAGALAGTIGSAVANKKANDLIANQRKENKTWYDMKRAEDYTQRSDIQAILKRQRELFEEQYKRSRATNIVAGGTDESLALQQQQANQTMSDTMTNIAGQASAHKDAAESAYRQQDAQLNQQQVAIKQNQANQIAQAGGQVVGAGLGMIGNAIKSNN